MMEIIVTIEKIVQGFYGLAHINNRTIFVEDVLPDEVVEIEPLSTKGSILFARPKNIIKASPDRVIPFCNHYKECGGCNVQYMNYDKELEFKSEIVKENIKRIANIEVEFSKPIAFSKDINYRSRCKFSYSNNKFGFKKRNSNEVVEIDNCPLLINNINNQIKELRKERKDLYVQATDEDISTDDKIIPIKVLDKTLYANSKVFFQSNMFTTELLIKDLLEQVKGTMLVDLYSGVGLFSKFIESNKTTTYAVEKNKYCLNIAKKHLHYTKFYTNDVKNFKLNKPIDTLIVDPPRVGIDKKVVSLINKLNPINLIYVSCESTTLARDLARLTDYGYSIKFLRAYDFYPHTSHVETICLMSRIPHTI